MCLNIHTTIAYLLVYLFLWNMMERKGVLWGQVTPGHVVSESPAILARKDWERLARSLQLGV